MRILDLHFQKKSKFFISKKKNNFSLGDKGETFHFSPIETPKKIKYVGTFSYLLLYYNVPFLGFKPMRKMT